MAFFDALGDKIKNAGQTIAQSTKNFTDVASQLLEAKEIIKVVINNTTKIIFFILAFAVFNDGLSFHGLYIYYIIPLRK